MAHDPGLAELMREALAHQPDITEKKMFGGLCFLWQGHMVCGVHSQGAMFRVGKPHESAALGLRGVSPLAFTGKPMGGMVDVTSECLVDDARRDALMQMALAFVRSLPPKA